VGAPTKCDAVVTESVCALVRDGLRLDAALDHVGISRRAGAYWQTRGDAGEEPFCTFVQAVARAQAEFEATQLDAIRTQSTHGPEGTSNEDWKARAWLLERTRPDAYAPSQTIVVKALATARSEVLDAVDAVSAAHPEPLTGAQWRLLVLSALAGEVDGDDEAEHVEH